MKYKYIVTGYWKKIDKMNTQRFKLIDDVVWLINSFDQSNPIIKNANDFDFTVQSRASHNGAEIVDTGDIIWSVAYLK